MDWLQLCSCGHTRAAHSAFVTSCARRACECEKFLAWPQPPQPDERHSPHTNWEIVKARMAERLIEHPQDMCTCGHTREQHVTTALHPNGFCNVPGDAFEDEWADDCKDFALAKTALAAAIDASEDLNQRLIKGIQEAHNGTTTDLGDFTKYLEMCVECGHDGDPHTQGEGGCNLCDCKAGARVTCPAPPAQTHYAVTYAVNDGDEEIVHVPYGANVTAIDGILKIWHPGRPVLAITTIRTEDSE